MKSLSPQTSFIELASIWRWSLWSVSFWYLEQAASLFKRWHSWLKNNKPCEQLLCTHRGINAFAGNIKTSSFSQGPEKFSMVKRRLNRKCQEHCPTLSICFIARPCCRIIQICGFAVATLRNESLNIRKKFNSIPTHNQSPLVSPG